MTDRIDEMLAHLSELEDDSCHKSLWWTDDICHLLSELDAAKAENERLQGGDGWISVSDRLPDDTRDVLATDGKDRFIANYGRDEGGARGYWWGDGMYQFVIYWQPLPEMPDVEDGDDVN